MALRVVHMEALYNRHFLGVQVDKNNIQLRLKIDSNSDLLSDTDRGLFVSPPSWGQVKDKPDNFIFKDGNYVKLSAEFMTAESGFKVVSNDGKWLRWSFNPADNQFKIKRSEGAGEIAFPQEKTNQKVAYQSWVKKQLGNIITGPGRPDDLETTKVDGVSVLEGVNTDGTVYYSTNGHQYNGAHVWQKRNGKWICTDGDTGLINVTYRSYKIHNGRASYVKFRRIGQNVYVYMGGLAFDLFGYAGKKEKGYSRRQPGRIEIIPIAGIPEGFRADSSQNYILFDDDTNKPVASLYIGGSGDSNFARITPYNNDPKVTGDDLIPDIGPFNLRAPSIVYTTSEPWPKNLPNVPPIKP